MLRSRTNGTVPGGLGRRLRHNGDAARMGEAQRDHCATNPNPDRVTAPQNAPVQYRQLGTRFNSQGAQPLGIRRIQPFPGNGGDTRQPVPLKVGKAQFGGKGRSPEHERSPATPRTELQLIINRPADLSSAQPRQRSG